MISAAAAGRRWRRERRRHIDDGCRQGSRRFGRGRAEKLADAPAFIAIIPLRRYGMMGSKIGFPFPSRRARAGDAPAGPPCFEVMMPQLTPEEIDAYLDGPHVAHFASIRPDGAPHIAPVWYRWADGKVTVVSGDAAVKTRNARRNPKVAVSIATDEWPYLYVILEGDATVRTDNLKEAVRSIFSRYEGQERGEQDANELTEGGQQLVAIEVAVNRILSWKGDEQ